MLGKPESYNTRRLLVWKPWLKDIRPLVDIWDMCDSILIFMLTFIEAVNQIF